MIQTGFGYVSFLIVFCGLAFWITTKYSHLRVFQILSPVVIIYLGISICCYRGSLWRNRQCWSGTGDDKRKSAALRTGLAAAERRYPKNRKNGTQTGAFHAGLLAYC